MSVDLRTFTDPRLNGAFATSAVAASACIFAYSTLVGPVAILLYYALWLPWLALLLPGLRITPALALVAAAIIWVLASTVWSEHPGTTLRAGLQFASHIACIVVIARTVSFTSLARGLVIGAVLIVLYSLQVGRYSYDSLDGSYTLVGAFGSKNQLGFNASIGIYFAVALLLWREARATTYVLVGTATALLCFVLWRSQSATSIASLAAALAVFAALRLTTVLSLDARRVASWMGWIGVALVPVVLFNSGLLDSVLSAFGKDSTLTGRTYLWAQGLEVFAQRPWAGIGYGAFWVEGSALAERFWMEFYITSRSGFHFHNTVIELLVEVGLIGTVPFVLLLLVSCLKPLRRVIRVGDTASAALAGLAFMFLMRSMFEVDTISAYSLGSFLVLYIVLVHPDVLHASAPVRRSVKQEATFMASA